MLGEVATAVVLDWLICWPVVKLFPPKTIICGPLSLSYLVEGEIIIILPVIHSLKVNIVIILHGGGGDNNNISSNPQS
jgi:hypothetical protein